MTSRLLDKILKDFAESNLSHQRIVFVLPSKRSVYYSKNFLKNYFFQKGITRQSPEFTTIEEFFEKISGLTLLSKIDLNYYLYKSYHKIFGDDSEPYFNFLKWSSMLLDDFNDILMSHPNNPQKQKDIFTNLKNIKDIEHWSLNKEPLSENQKRYLHLMEKFYDIFTDFNNTLLSEGLAYKGLNAEQVIKIISNPSEYQKNQYLQSVHQFIFVGLNAILLAEEIAYKFLKQENKAKFYWDYDPYYTQENSSEKIKNEAGLFLRNNFKTFGIEEDNRYQTSLFDEPKEILITSAANDVEEISFIKKTLLDHQKENPEFKNVVIILNKPEALNLILSAIPDDVDYNVSLEYPLKLTPSYQLLIQLLKIFVHLLTDSRKKNQIYHKHFTTILLNPVLKSYLWHTCKISPFEINKIITSITKLNKIYISVDDEILNLEDKTDNFKKYFLDIFNEKSFTGIITQIRKIFESELDYLENENKNSEHKKNIITKNINQAIVEQLNKIEYLLQLDNNEVFKDIKDVYALVQQIVSRESLSFKGEPMKGLQIIGLLETRLLDFEYCIIPFMNEGIFPPESSKPTFIPFDLRIYHQLPTYYNEDAISSYLFYRSIQYPKKIFLSYTSSVGNDESGLKDLIKEKSRFIQQINFELVEKQNIKIQNKNINTAIFKPASYEISIEKSDEIIEKLKQIRYSPSSLNTYLKCSLKFYFEKILKLKAQEEVDEDLAANEEGNIFHSFMAHLYSKEDVLDENKCIDTKKLKAFIENKKDFIYQYVENEIKNLFSGEYNNKLEITKRVLAYDIIKLLEKEIKAIGNKKIKIIYTENEKNKDNKNSDTIYLETNYGKVELSGFIDRIDYVLNENLYRIVDYKSSFSNDDDNLKFEISQLDKFKTSNDFIKKTEKLNQLLFYILYAKNKNLIPHFEKISGVIIPLRMSKKSDELYQNVSFNGKNYLTKDESNEIEKYFIGIFNEIIFNKEMDIKQTDDTYTCNYCDFKYICKKEVKEYNS